MWLLDQWAERHITDAQSKGEFDGLLVQENRWFLTMIPTFRRNFEPDSVY